MDTRTPTPTAPGAPPPPAGGRVVLWFDRFQRRHSVLGFPIAVIYKYFDDTGAYLAALLTYYGFLSLFPLLLILSTVLGIVLARDEHLRQQILGSAVHQFPLIGDQLDDPRKLSGGTRGLIIGAVGSLYGGLGVAQAMQHAMNTAWGVPRNSRPNPFHARGRSMLLLLIVGLSVLGTTAVSVIADKGVLNDRLARDAATAGGVLVSIATFAVLFRMSASRSLSWRDVLPGAIVGAVVWQLLQRFGIAYVSHVVRNASTTNSVFALVLGLIAFIFIAAVVLVLSIEINVVRSERLWPRALLTPFTDAVELTDGDRRAYIALARTQRTKGFQRIDVAFGERMPDDDGDNEDGSESGEQPEAPVSEP